MEINKPEEEAIDWEKIALVCLAAGKQMCGFLSGLLLQDKCNLTTSQTCSTRFVRVLFDTKLCSMQLFITGSE